MRSTAPSLTPTRRRLRQARPLYQLRDLQPAPLRPYRFVWWIELAKLIFSVMLVIGAALIWVVKPWL